MTVNGNIKVIKDTVEVSDSFRKREFVITTNDMYPQDILIQMVQDKCDILNNFEVGQDVEVSINLRGREWTSPQGEVKYFNTIEGWKVNLASEVADNQQTQEAESVNNDLPF